MKPKLHTARVAAFLLLALAPALLHARGPVLDDIVGMRVVGEARLRVLFWDIYDARLLAPEGRYASAGPFALELTYLRRLDGEKIAARAIEEIRRQGPRDESVLARWEEALLRIIPDVRSDDTITGIASEDGSTHFLLDGELIGEVEDPAFTRAFFAIWLGEESSEPLLRDRLLGMRS
jgi:hypothetical protein